jgi:hypothetical protein
MANYGYIAKDTLFGPERPSARAIDWGRSDRGLSSGRAATVLQSRRRIHGRTRNHASVNRNALAPREPSIHGSRECPNGEYGLAKTLYNRWKRWSEKGVFARIMAGLAAEGADHKTIMIDATYLKAHRTASSLRKKRGACSPNRAHEGRHQYEITCRH